LRLPPNLLGFTLIRFLLFAGRPLLQTSYIVAEQLVRRTHLARQRPQRWPSGLRHLVPCCELCSNLDSTVIPACVSYRSRRRSEHRRAQGYETGHEGSCLGMCKIRATIPAKAAKTDAIDREGLLILRTLLKAGNRPGNPAYRLIRHYEVSVRRLGLAILLCVDFGRVQSLGLRGPSLGPRPIRRLN